MCQVVQTREEALSTRLLQATIHALELYGIYLVVIRAATVQTLATGAGAL